MLSAMESRTAAAEVLRDFQQYQMLKRQHAERHHPHTVDSRTAVVVPGIAGHYAMRHGMQYYRDLAGNVKQVGFFRSFYRTAVTAVSVAPHARVQGYKNRRVLQLWKTWKSHGIW